MREHHVEIESPQTQLKPGAWWFMENNKCYTDKRNLLPAQKPLVYIAGSMSQRPRILEVRNALRQAGYDTFQDWINPGEQTDEKWMEFAKAEGKTFIEALYSPHAQNVLAFDKEWMERSDAFVLAYPAGRSGHTELGFCHGRDKPTFVLLDKEPERFDVMLGLSTRVVDNMNDLIAQLREHV